LRRHDDLLAQQAEQIQPIGQLHLSKYSARRGQIWPSFLLRIDFADLVAFRLSNLLQCASLRQVK
jgi:hypothetical protein